MALAMWNSSSAGSVIRSFWMSHTKYFLVRAAMTLFSVVLSGTSLTSGWRQTVCPTLCVPRCHRWRSSRRHLGPAPPGPTVIESLDQPPRVTWSRSRNEPPRICWRPRLQGPRRQITVRNNVRRTGESLLFHSSSADLRTHAQFVVLSATLQADGQNKCPFFHYM